MRERDITKLPQWAQRKIETLEVDIKYVENQMQGLHGREETNVYFEIGHTTLEPKRVFLPNGGTISFHDYHGHTIDVRVSRRGGVKVSTWGNLRVCPEAANVVRVEGVGRAEKR